MKTLEALFQRAMDLPAAERDGFLTEACDGDGDLKAAVQRLLASDQLADELTFWRNSALKTESRFESPGSASRVGQVLGAYRIVEVIGEGGMGTVYRAVRADSVYEQAVAIKIVRGGFDSAVLAERFLQERQILANVSHPNIARLLDGGATPDGPPYLVMEFIDGKPLTAYCSDQNLNVAERLRLFREACSAVEYAHQRLVVHRDLKPSNILVNHAGEVKLLDFGVAKLVAKEPDYPTQQTIGMHWLTPGYASPEQILGETMTTASDVYSLGVILYELLCGHSPYGKKPATLPEAIRAVQEQEPLPPSETLSGDSAARALARELKGDLDRILLKALRKEPARRYGSVEQLSEDLRRYLAGLPVRARGDAFTYRAAKFTRRNAIPVAAGAVVFITLVVGIVMTMRAEARVRKQFNEVRRLAHAVLFDYHDAIEPLPGSTPVRQMLVKDALGYLDGLSQQTLDDGLESEIALAYVKVADVQGNTYNSNLGDTEGGMQSARKAVAHAEPLYRRNPTAENAYVLGRAYLTMAILIHSSDKIAGAEEYYKRAAELFAKATAAAWNADWQMRRIETLDHLGDLYGLEGYANLGRSKDALAAYARAHELSAKLAQKNPASHDAQEVLFLTQLSVAGAERRLGHAAAAEDGYRGAIAVNQKMVDEGSGSPSDQQNLATAYFALANQLLDDGKPREALPYMRRSHELVQQIAAADQRNALFQRSLAGKELGLCNVLRADGAVVQALPHCREGLASLQRLSDADPQSGDKQIAVADGLRQLGEAQLAAGNPRDALTKLRRSLNILHQMPEAARDATLRLYLLRAHVTAGEAELALGHRLEAVADFRTASEVGEELIRDDPEHAYNRLDLAHAETHLARALAAEGECGEARLVVQQAIEDWKWLQGIGIVAPSETGTADSLKVTCQGGRKLSAK